MMCAEMIVSVHVKSLTRIGMSWQILVKFGNIKFFFNMLSNFLIIMWGCTGSYGRLWSFLQLFVVNVSEPRLSDPVHILGMRCMIRCFDSILVAGVPIIHRLIHKILMYVIEKPHYIIFKVLSTISLRMSRWPVDITATYRQHLRSVSLCCWDKHHVPWLQWTSDPEWDCILCQSPPPSQCWEQ